MERMVSPGGEGPRIVAERDERARFPWTAFYEAVGRRLLDYANDRKPLVEALHEIASRVPGMGHLNDRFSEGRKGPLEDICPFTVFGTFNKGLKDENRQAIAAELAGALGVTEFVPSSFEGIPVLNNQRSWFFNYAAYRKPGDTDRLWRVFVAAVRLVAAWKAAAGVTDDMQSAAGAVVQDGYVSDGGVRSARDTFVRAYDEAMEVWGTAWNLTTGLFWAHPWDFPSLDSHSRRYIQERLGQKIPIQKKGDPCDGASYLALREQLTVLFSGDSYPVHSFPALSLEAGRYRSPLAEDGAMGGTPKFCMADGEQEQTHGTDDAGCQGSTDGADETVQLVRPALPYAVQDILDDGCFLDEAAVERMLKRLREKKNLILQGPPGTGKTWLAKRLAFALMGQKDEGRVRTVQFHPNLSYEDFVRGWRPAGDGRLKLADGVFMQAIAVA